MDPDALSRSCESAALRITFADGSSRQRLTVDDVMRIAQDMGVPGSEVERAALARGIVPERYERSFDSFSVEDQSRLLASRATVIGLGGLGGVVTEILARIGVGYLRLVDGDRFEGHNLNRQFLSTTGAIGTPKAKAARERVEAVNPSVQVDTASIFLIPANADELIRGSHVVVDCLDSIEGRFNLESACKRCGIPMVSAAIAGMSGQVTVIFPGDRGLESVYGDPSPTPAKGAEATLGTLPMAVGVAASLECGEAVKILLNQMPALRNRLLIFDLAAGIFETVDLCST